MPVQFMVSMQRGNHMWWMKARFCLPKETSSKDGIEIGRRNSSKPQHPIDFQSLPTNELEHLRSIAVRLATSNAISRHCLFEEIKVQFLRAFGSFLTCDDYAPGKCFHLFSKLVFVVPDVRVEKSMVIAQHCREVQRI